MSKNWIGNENSIFKTLGSSAHSDGEREINDFYATHPSAIDYLLEVETFNNNIWENAVGQGHLAQKLIDKGYNVKSSDIIDRGFPGTEIINFLESDIKFDGDIITNPPYKYCTEFILGSLNSIPKGNKVAMFLKLLTLESVGRYEEIYSTHPPKTVYVFSRRIQCAKNGVFGNGGAVCYAWYVWEKGYTGDTTLKWILHKP